MQEKVTSLKLLNTPTLSVYWILSGATHAHVVLLFGFLLEGHKLFTLHNGHVEVSSSQVIKTN